MKNEIVNKVVLCVLILFTTSCQHDRNKIDNIPERPEMIYQFGDLPGECFKYTDTVLDANSHTTIFIGNAQTLIDDITDGITSYSCETIRMRFVNNPWALTKEDSIYVLFAGKLVYSGNFNYIVDIEIPVEIMNKKIIVQFITKKNGVICYYNSNENYQWYFMDPNTVGVDFVFLTGKTDFPPFYLNFINKSEVHYPELYPYKKSPKDSF